MNVNENSKYITQEQVDNFTEKCKEYFDIDIKCEDRYMDMFSIFKMLHEKYFANK